VREAYEIIEEAMIINWCVVLRVQCTLGSTSFFALCVLSPCPGNFGGGLEYRSRNTESNKRFIRFGQETEVDPYVT
jgi:hypothetical protein